MVELTIVSVPSTWRSPLIRTLPVLSPTAAGSITISAGPVIVLTPIPIPFGPVLSSEEVTIPDTVKLPVAFRFPVTLVSFDPAGLIVISPLEDDNVPDAN